MNVSLNVVIENWIAASWQLSTLFKEGKKVKFWIEYVGSILLQFFSTLDNDFMSKLCMFEKVSCPTSNLFGKD